jgi:hypothetical protein
MSEDKRFRINCSKGEMNPPPRNFSTARQPHGEVEELRQHVYKQIVLRRHLLSTDPYFQAQQQGGLVYENKVHARKYHF